MPSCTYIGAILLYFIVIIMSSDCSHISAKIIMDNVVEKKIGNRIRMLREDAGITQEELATRMQIYGCDITRSAVAKIEVGQRHLYPDEIILITQILKVSYDEIFKID